eukprot:3443902-Pleurochrysis_carterae.AAC.1
MHKFRTEREALCRTRATQVSSRAARCAIRDTPYLPAVYAVLNGRCDVSQLRDFAARILHPHGGPSVVRLSVKHSIGAAISHCRKQLTPKCKWRQSHVAARGEWVLQVPAC